MSRIVRARRPGVRLRITLGVGLAFALALVAAATFLVVRQRAALTDDIETTGRLRAADLVAGLEAGSPPGSVAIPFEDRAFVQVIDEMGRVVGSSPNIDGEPPIVTFAADRAQRDARSIDGLPVGDEPFRVVAGTADVRGQILTVYVGSSLEPVDQAIRELLLGLTLGAPALLLVVMSLTWLAVGRALRPVEQIRAEVADIGERELHRRVPQPPEDDEIGRLASTMNTMLARLEEAAARKRRFLADASHELRSPLTGMRSQLEVDLAHPDLADWQATERDLLEETLHMQRLVDDLLDIAALDERPAAAEHELVDVDEIVLAEVRRLSTRGKVIVDARKVSAAQVIGDTDALGRAIRNLLDNAERHATRAVDVAVRQDGRSVQIVVSDDGRGVAEHDRNRIFERFARADPSRSRTEGGTGLGLSIARDIVEAHQGTLSLADHGRGATFVIDLPEA